MPVDEEGLVVEEGIDRAPGVRLIYLTPSHQFLLGVTLNLARRSALLDWARRADAYILEDDYDSEYHYTRRPLPALQGLIAILHFIWPFALLYIVLKVPYWIILSLYQPNLVFWLESVAAVVFLKGLLEIALAWRVFWQVH